MSQEPMVTEELVLDESVVQGETIGAVPSEEFEYAIGTDANHVSPNLFQQQRLLDDDRQRRFKERLILNTWVRQEESERRLRKQIAWLVFLGLLLELGVGNYAFIALGFGKMQFPQWSIQTFYLGMYGQVASMAYFVVKGLFPASKLDSLPDIRRMVMNQSISDAPATHAQQD